MRLRPESQSDSHRDENSVVDSVAALQGDTWRPDRGVATLNLLFGSSSGIETRCCSAATVSHQRQQLPAGTHFLLHPPTRLEAPIRPDQSL